MRNDKNKRFFAAALAAALAIALAFTLTACEEKKKPKDGDVAPAAAIESGSFTDSRDGKTYKTVKIGEQVWMAENLSYKAEGSICYDNDSANCEKYGRLYDWEDAMKACPSGWHLPTKEEWDALTNFAGGDEVAEKKLKARNGWDSDGNGTDNYGFSALPGGRGSPDGDFALIKNGGRWWSTSDNYRRMNSDYQHIWDSSDLMFLFSIRCLQGETQSQSSSVRLLKVAKDVNGETIEFEYDNKNRITEVSIYGYETKTIAVTYHDNNSVTAVFSYPEKGISNTTRFVINGNKISFSSKSFDGDGNEFELETTMTVNNDGYITKRVAQYKASNERHETAYQYQNGNLIKETIDGTIFKYIYDNKKSPFYNCKTPKWFLQEYILGEITLGQNSNYSSYSYNNNITESSCSNPRACPLGIGYNHKYDSGGFPFELEVYESFDLGDEGTDGSSSLIKFKYKLYSP